MVERWCTCGHRAEAHTIGVGECCSTDPYRCPCLAFVEGDGP